MASSYRPDPTEHIITGRELVLRGGRPLRAVPQNYNGNGKDSEH